MKRIVFKDSDWTRADGSVVVACPGAPAIGDKKPHAPCGASVTVAESAVSESGGFVFSCPSASCKFNGPATLEGWEP